MQPSRFSSTPLISIQNSPAPARPLGLMYGDGGESALGAENISRAYELRDRASDAEKVFILAYYDGRATGNLEKAEQTCSLWAQTYPRERLPHSFLLGFIYLASGKYEKSIEEAQKVMEIDSDSIFPYAVLASDYIALDRMDDAENAIMRWALRENWKVLNLRHCDTTWHFSKVMPVK